MQTKKRARAIKFGKKTETHKEEKEEAKKPKDEVIIEATPKESPKEEIPASLPVTQDTESASNEKKNTEPENQVLEQPKEEEKIAVTEIQEATTVEAPPVPILTEPKQATDNSSAIKMQGSDTYIVEKEVKKNMLGYFFLVAVVAFIIGLISMAGISFLIQKMSNGTLFSSSKTTQTSPTPNIGNKPSPTAMVLNLTEYSIKILNGSEIAGAATKLKDSLIQDGFKVAEIGNADKNDYTDTIIFAKKDTNTAYLDKLKNTLKKIYVLGPDTKIPPVSTSEADIIITIGSTAAQK